MKNRREETPKERAQRLLKLLRSETEFYDPYLEQLHRVISKGGLTLNDIGTSKEELKELRRKGIVVAAKKALERLRLRSRNIQDHNDRLVLVQGIEAGAKKGSFTLSEIGTSTVELWGIYTES